jgi:hypothetical protein
VEPSDRGSTRIGIALLAATLLSALLLVLAAAIGEPEAARAGAHPAFGAMQHGGASTARTGSVLAIGGAFGLVQIGFFGLCFGLGMRRREGLGPVLRPLLLCLAAYAAVWIVLIASYLAYASDPAGTERWLGFPLPTAILLFGFWPLPVVFCVLYLRHFDYVLDEARLADFRERLEALRAEGGDD